MFSQTLPFLRIPAVSIIVYSLPSAVLNLVSTASRVVPSIFDTITRSSFNIEFTKLDLPTLGRPIKLNLIESSSSVSLESSGNISTILSNKSPIPVPCEPDIGIGSPKPKV